MSGWIKDPDAVLDYTIDWSAWLGPDTLAGVDVTPSSDEITVDSTSFTDTTATAIISGGEDGTDYEIVFQITTAAALVDDRTITLLVRQR
jgi:hypothetical protein